MFGFFKNYTKVTFKNAGEGFIGFLHGIDYANASEADLMEIDDKLTEASKALAEARSEWKKEKADVDVITAKYNNMLKDVERAEAALTEDRPDDVKAQLTELINGHLTELETMAPEVEREKTEEKDAREFMDLLETAVREHSANVKNARANLASKKRQLDTANIKKERAESKAAILSGLGSTGAGISKGMEVLDKKVKEAQEAAEAAEIKAGALANAMKKPEPSKSLDDILGATKPAETTAERIARLKATAA